MRRRSRNQLVLDLGRDGRTAPSMAPPEGLLQALADLLLEALCEQNKVIPADLEVCDASEDHT
jgi:hypothetical protein